MRETLFRGRTKDGTWHYGQYVKADRASGNHGFHVDWIVSHFTANGGWLTPLSRYAVDGDTVGQYTGLTDKNGTRIFEGDIVVDTWGENKWVVRYFDGRFWGVDTNNYYAEEELGELADLMPGGFEGVTVFGNVHDNPELIGGAE